MADLNPGFKHEVHNPFIHATRPNEPGTFGIVYHFFDSELQAKLWMRNRRGYSYLYREWGEPHLSKSPIYLHGERTHATTN